MGTENAIVVSVKRTFSPEGFLKHLDDVQDGERMQLPEFFVPARVIDGMEFDEVKVDGECASVYDVQDGEINLVFDHVIMWSAIDKNWNKDKTFLDTPLGKWLCGLLADGMRAVGVPVAECGLLRKEDLWGKDAKPFFMDGRNRVCFDFDEDYSLWYWTETIEDASAANFCYAYNLGYASYIYASYASLYVRPRFKILKS